MLSPSTNELESNSAKDIKDQIIIALQEKLPSIVHEEVSREEERRYRQIKWFVAFIGVVGLGTFGTLANYLIEKAVDSRIEAKAGNISESIDYMRFYTVTLKLDLGTSYSNEEKDVVMTYLRSAAKVDRIRHSKEFLAALTRVAKAFASSSQSAALDEVFSLYEKEVLSSPTLVEAFLHHYGQDIASRAAEPKQDTSFAIFEKLERASAKNSEELALYYRLLYSFRKADLKKNPETSALISRVPLFSEADLSRLLSEIFQHTRAENWQRRASPVGKEIESVSRKLLTMYGTEMATVLNAPNEVFVVAATAGIDKDKVDSLASVIAAKLKRRESK